jgi:hypothetical protein
MWLINNRYTCFIYLSSKLTDCGSVEKIENGAVTLDKESTTIGATATVKCDPGYKAEQKKIVCLKSGEWEKSSCKLKGAFHVYFIADDNN